MQQQDQTVAQFEKTLRVYYEDTDAGGIVYHSNYLNFMERCRCDWLLSLGFNIVDLADNQHVAFVVHEANIRFHKPAHLFDELKISLRVLHVGKVTLQLQQTVYNQHTKLCSATIKLAVIDAESFKPRPMPIALRQAIEFEQSSD